MGKKQQKQEGKYLEEIAGQSHCVRLARKPIDKHDLRGFVVGANRDKEWVLLHLVEENTVTLNGYSAVRDNDVNRFRTDDVLDRALTHRGVKPVPQPKIDLTDVRTLLTSVNNYYPLFAIRTEKTDKKVCFIGKINRLSSRKLHLDEISTTAEWDYQGSYKLSDITRIDFGGGYETALYDVSKLKKK